MKLFLIAIFISTTALCQQQAESFKLTKAGFEDYVVIDLPDKSSEEIYTNLKKWAEYNIRNASYSNYSEIKNEFLSYRIFIPSAFEAKDVITTIQYDVVFDIELRFKNERLRLDVFIFSVIDARSKHSLKTSGGLYSIFKKNGQIRRQNMYKDIKKGLEELAGEMVVRLKLAAEGDVDVKKDDW